MDYMKSSDWEIGAVIERCEWVEGTEIGDQTMDIRVGAGSNIWVQILVWILACELSLGSSCCCCCYHHCLCHQEVQDQDLQDSLEVLGWGLDVVCLEVFQVDCHIYDRMVDFGLAEASFFAFSP